MTDFFDKESLLRLRTTCSRIREAIQLSQALHTSSCKLSDVNAHFVFNSDLKAIQLLVRDFKKELVLFGPGSLLEKVEALSLGRKVQKDNLANLIRTCRDITTLSFNLADNMTIKSFLCLSLVENFGSLKTLEVCVRNLHKGVKTIV